MQSLVIRNRDNFRIDIQKKIFITALKKLLNVSVAVEVTGLKRSVVYEWRKDDADFAEQWDDAIALAQGALESATYLKIAQILQDDRKRLGMPEAKMIELLLGGAFPDKYKQRSIEIDNSTNNFTNTIDWSIIPDDVFNAFNAGQLTLKDVYDWSLQSKEQERSATGEDRRDEGSGAT